jgi:glyoxylase-like metal-dependent hydrolase (beta-lactamase superfamily II)
VDARIEQVVTTGKVSLDDDDYEVETNTYLVGDDEEVIVIDPANDAEAILKEVGDREVMAVICTNGHDNIVSTVLEVAADEENGDAPIGLHQRDRLLWRRYFRKLARETDDDDLKDIVPDIDLEDGGIFEIAGIQLEVMHTPGFTPGSVTLFSEQLGVLFTGNTLHHGKPGEIGGHYPDLQGQLNSIGSLVGPMDGDIKVLPGMGPETTVGEEAARWETWYTLDREETDE